MTVTSVSKSCDMVLKQQARRKRNNRRRHDAYLVVWPQILDYCCVCIVHWLLLFSRLTIHTHSNETPVTVGCVSGGWEVSRWRCEIQSANKGLQVCSLFRLLFVLLLVGVLCFLFEPRNASKNMQLLRLRSFSTRSIRYY
jgi:hypothetical protein